MSLGNVGWLPSPNRVDIWMGSQTPSRPLGPCTAAFVVAHRPDGRMLLVEHRDRGPDLPGGHLEPGETPAAAAVRELAEETGVTLDPARLDPGGIIGCWVQAPRPAGYRYPHPYSHMVVHFATLSDQDVDQAAAVTPDQERTGRRWATVAEVVQLCPGAPWLVFASLSQAR